MRAKARHARGLRPGRPALQAGLTHLLLAALGLCVAFPFIWMVLSAVKSQDEALSFPPVVFPAAPQWHNFVEAWQAGPFARYLLNTGFVAISVTLSVMFTALLAGYAFGQLEFPGKNALFVLYLATMMIPFEVVLIPNFLMVNRLGWYDTYAAM